MKKLTQWPPKNHLSWTNGTHTMLWEALACWETDGRNFWKAKGPGIGRLWPFTCQALPPNTRISLVPEHGLLVCRLGLIVHGHPSLVWPTGPSPHLPWIFGSDCKPPLLPFLSYCPCCFNLHLEEASLTQLLSFLRHRPGSGPSLLARGSGPLTFWLCDMWIFFLGDPGIGTKQGPPLTTKAKRVEGALPLLLSGRMVHQALKSRTLHLAEVPQRRAPDRGHLLQRSEPKATEGAIGGNGPGGTHWLHQSCGQVLPSLGSCLNWVSDFWILWTIWYPSNKFLLWKSEAEMFPLFVTRALIKCTRVGELDCDWWSMFTIKLGLLGLPRLSQNLSWEAPQGVQTVTYISTLLFS